MFNPKRVLRFWGRLLRVILPLYGLLALLAYLALRSGERFDSGWKLAVGLALGLAPATIAIIGGFVLAIPYMRKLYALKNRGEIFYYLLHCLFGQAGFKPWLLLEEAKINEQRNPLDSLIVKVGGPGNLVIRKDTAVVLEQGGRLTRALGPGFPRLERMERVYDILDLRPGRWVYAVSGMSKEGIPVTCDADVVYQLLGGDQEPTGLNPYPMEPHAVFVASTGKWIREANRPESERVMDWRGRIIISATEGALRFILARYPLDRLIAPEMEGQEHPRTIICRELEAELVKFAPNVGARILKVELGQIKVEDAVTQQWIESWRADWHRWESEYLALAEAAYVETVGNAQAEVIARRIRDTTNALIALADKSRDAFVAGALSQLYLGMRKISADSLALTYLPAEATKMLQRVSQLSLTSGTPNEQAPAQEPESDGE